MRKSRGGRLASGWRTAFETSSYRLLRNFCIWKKRCGCGITDWFNPLCQSCIKGMIHSVFLTWKLWRTISNFLASRSTGLSAICWSYATRFSRQKNALIDLIEKECLAMRELNLHRYECREICCFLCRFFSFPTWNSLTCRRVLALYFNICKHYYNNCTHLKFTSSNDINDNTIKRIIHSVFLVFHCVIASLIFFWLTAAAALSLA